ncbi:MAG: hypothetical protein JWN20_1358 [Jatrophihabitantaceae bacterium]|nr:hypothetical protein [Jatrophihabitantaceae bacterium]
MTVFALPDADPLPLDVLGTDGQARLQVRLSAEVLDRVMAGGVFGAGRELTAGVVEAADRTGELEARLRAVPGAAPDPDLDAVAAEAWLASDSSRAEARAWVLAGWETSAGPIRTIWDYVPLDGAGGLDAADAGPAQSAALQFILDEHPELPIELTDLAQAMSLLELPGSSAPLAELAAVLTELGVANQRLPGDGPLGFTMGDDDDEWQCLADVTESDWLVLYAELPEYAVAVDGSFAEALVVVARINARLQVGALVIDGDEGSLMYRAATDVASPMGRIGVLRRLLDLVYADVQSVLAAWREGI